MGLSFQKEKNVKLYLKVNSKAKFFAKEDTLYRQRNNIFIDFLITATKRTE